MLGRQPEDAHTLTDSREATFARIVHEHARFLYRVAHSVLRHAEDAEDAVQDALLKLYRGEGWREMREERAFLARVVWRAALDKRERRLVSFERGFENEGAELYLPDLRPTPERAAAEGDERALLHELIDELPAELRETLLLSAIEELNSREVGEVMGVPEGTVRTRLMRARSELRARFKGAGFEERKIRAGLTAGREVAAGERTTR
jgi:RNA polymerase sigma-70 factor (ECF subfamily)